MPDITLKFTDERGYVAFLDQLARDSDGKLTRRGIHDLIDNFAVERPTVSLDERIFTPLSPAETLRITNFMDRIYMGSQDSYFDSSISRSPAIVNVCAEYTLTLLEKVPGEGEYSGNYLHRALYLLYHLTPAKGLYSTDLDSNIARKLGRKITNLLGRISPIATFRGENGCGKDKFKEILQLITGGNIEQLASFKKSFLDIQYNIEGRDAPHLNEECLNRWYFNADNTRTELTHQAVEYARTHLNL